MLTFLLIIATQALPAAAMVDICQSPVVHDGDTIRCGDERIRIADIDAPELPGSPRCDPQHLRTGANPSWCDYDKGYQARDALAAFLSHGPVIVHRHGADRYGRTLAELTVNDRDAGDYLISLDLARRWVN